MLEMHGFPFPSPVGVRQRADDLPRADHALPNARALCVRAGTRWRAAPDGPDLRGAKARQDPNPHPQPLPAGEGLNHPNLSRRERG